jgi:hypothetical protein
MKESTKGAFLSGLVYPGLGQMVLGSIFTGAFFILSTTAGFLVVIYRLTKRIYQAIDQILPMLASDTFNVNKFIETVSRSSYDSWRVEGVSLILVLGCWFASIGHAYMLGRKLDRHRP